MNHPDRGRDTTYLKGRPPTSAKEAARALARTEHGATVTREDEATAVARRVRRILRFREWPKQQQASQLVLGGLIRFLLFGGAIGGGKTLWLMNCMQALARIFARSRWAIVRADLPRLKRTTIPSFERVRATNFVGELNRSDWTYYCANGSEIILFPESLKHDPTYQRFLGLEVNGFAVDQAEETARGTFVMCRQRAGRWSIPPTPQQEEVMGEYIDERMREHNESYEVAFVDARKHFGPRQPPPLWLGTCNPHDGWVRDTFYDPYERGELDAPFAFVPSTIDDNPGIDPEYRKSVEALKDTDPQEYLRMIKGMWGVLVNPRAVIQTSWILNARNVEIPDGAKKLRTRLGVDVARMGTNDTVLAFGDEYDTGDGDDTLIDLTELQHVKKATVPEVARAIRSAIVDRKLKHNDVTIDVGGGIGAGAYDMLREWKFNVRAFLGGSRAVARPSTGAYVYKFKNKRAQALWEAREKLQATRVRISVPLSDPSWQRLQKDWITPEYEPYGDREIEIWTKEQVVEALGRSPDDGDAAMMMLYDPGVESEETMIPPTTSRRSMRA